MAGVMLIGWPPASASVYTSPPVEPKSLMMPAMNATVLPSGDTFGVATYSDKVSAEAILGLLSGAGLPAYIESDEHVPGLGTHFSVFVPNDRARQARRILEQGRVSEKELTDLAMGVEPDG